MSSVPQLVLVKKSRDRKRTFERKEEGNIQGLMTCKLKEEGVIFVWQIESYILQDMLMHLPPAIFVNAYVFVL